MSFSDSELRTLEFNIRTPELLQFVLDDNKRKIYSTALLWAVRRGSGSLRSFCLRYRNLYGGDISAMLLQSGEEEWENIRTRLYP